MNLQINTDLRRVVDTERLRVAKELVPRADRVMLHVPASPALFLRKARFALLEDFSQAVSLAPDRVVAQDEPDRNTRRIGNWAS